jgi:protein-tyrosine phosphatase
VRRAVNPSLTRTGENERHLRVRGTRNLRDVGGYPAGEGRQTRWRTLYRSDSLDRLPERSQRELLDLGLRCVIDLRWPHELIDAPSVFARSDRVHYVHLSLWPDDAPPAGLVEGYVRALDTRGDVVAMVARALLEPDGLPAVIGCAAGVDRTGLSIALLLSAVGVPADVVAADYGMSVDTYAATEGATGFGTDWRSRPVTLDCVPDYMLQALDHVERRHGGARGLLRNHGLAKEELDRLTELLTEVAPG